MNSDTAIAWLHEQAQDIGLEFRKIDFSPPALFTIVLKWEGYYSSTSEGSIMLNSHMDVVAVDPVKYILKQRIQYNLVSILIVFSRLNGNMAHLTHLKILKGTYTLEVLKIGNL